MNSTYHLLAGCKIFKFLAFSVQNQAVKSTMGNQVFVSLRQPGLPSKGMCLCLMILVLKVAEGHTTRDVSNVRLTENLINLALLDVVVVQYDAPKSFHVDAHIILEVIGDGRACTTPHGEG